MQRHACFAGHGRARRPLPFSWEEGEMYYKNMGADLGFNILEQTLNGDSYSAGVSLLGGADAQSTKLWWDVN